MLDSVEKDIVAQDVTLKGLEKRRTATFKAFEQVGTTEAHQALSGPREAGKLLLLFFCGLLFVSGECIACHTVARQVQRVDRRDNALRVEEGVGIIGSFISNGKFDGARHANGKVGALTVIEGEVFAICDGIGTCIILLNEASRAAYQ